MEKYYYELLNFISSAPDTFISKEVIFNSLQWNYAKIDAVITDLLDNKYIDENVFDGIVKYKVNFKGNEFIKNFDKTNAEIVINKNNKNKTGTIKSIIFKILSVLEPLLSIVEKVISFVLKK